jgi:hypothetical protein
MARVSELLSRPYPQTLNRWWIIFVISIFISLFLIIFQPFGLRNLQDDTRLLILAGYGLVTCILLIINIVILPSIFPGLLGEDHWTIGKQVLFLCWIVATISAGNYGYSILTGVARWSGILGFTVFLVFTLMVAVLPITGLTMISYNRILREHLSTSGEINSLIMKRSPAVKAPGTILTISSENGKQTLSFPVEDLVFIASLGNYLSIRYLKEGTPEQLLIRNTMKNIEHQSNMDLLFKCHRAFIINPLLVEKVSGNSQGYRLQMRYFKDEIPVARSFTKSFRERMRDQPEG